jgi:hypothetical protein
MNLKTTLPSKFFVALYSLNLTISFGVKSIITQIICPISRRQFFPLTSVH